MSKQKIKEKSQQAKINKTGRDTTMQDDIQLDKDDFSIRNFFTDSAIIIALITGIGYLLAYTYMRSFYSYYGITEFSWDFSIKEILNTYYSLITISIRILFFVYLIFSIFLFKLMDSNKRKYIKNPLLYIVASIVLLSMSYYEEDKNYQIFIILGIIFLIISTVYLILLCFTSVFKNLGSPFIKTVRIFPKLALIFLMLFAFDKKGTFDAKQKNNYLSFAKNDKTYVMIYQDDNKSVFLQKENNDFFKKNYIWIMNSEMNNICFQNYKGKIKFE